jgi:hypothetical protein
MLKVTKTSTKSTADLISGRNLTSMPDDLARKYQQEYGKAHPFVLMTPRTGGFLIYPEGTTTSKYAQDIRHRATTTPLREYIRDEYSYSEAIMSTINWLECPWKSLENDDQKTEFI